jgi:methylated-DNA-[protein]-cysteine S-methyltransferase
MSRSGRWPAREHDARLPARFAVLGVVVEEDWLIGIDYLPTDSPPQPPRTALAAEVCAQLSAYLRDPRFRFDLPLHLAGTPYQRRVWDAVAQIPAGETRSYADLAKALHTGARAVGGACGANPIPLVIPCHRVVAAGGGLGGFMHARDGAPLDVKRWLLGHERR